MPEVVFYEARGPRWEAQLCSRVEALYEAGERVYVLAGSEVQARQLDDLLWTFSEGSFVPHALWQGEARCDEPVAVGWKDGNPNRATCLALACPEIPPCAAKYPRVIDTAPVDVPDLRQAARERYRQFQAAGYPLQFHKGE